MKAGQGKHFFCVMKTGGEIGGGQLIGRKETAERLTLPSQNSRCFRICAKFSFDGVKRKGGGRMGIAGGKRKCLLSNDIDNNENQCNMMASS